MIRTTFGKDRYAAGEYDYIVGTSRSWARTQPNGVIFCHAGSGTATSVAIDANLRTLLATLGRHATVHAGDLGGSTFGNDTGVTRVEQDRAYLRATWGQAGPLVLVTASMGFITATNYALRHPTEVAAIGAVVPGIDLADLMTRGAGIPELIDAAYPPGYNDTTDGPLHSPIQFVADLDPDLPIHLWTSSNDPYAFPATADAFVAARPQTGRTNLGALGHTGVQVATPAVTAFVEQYTYL